MRFLGIGDTCDLGDLYYRLGQARHEVKVYIAIPEAQNIYGGMITTVSDWRKELPWIREADKEGVILFESAGMGVIQDELRAAGYQVIGGSAYGDRLESDRNFGQQICAEIGLQTAASHHFTDYEAAIQFLKAHPARYVFKLNGASALRTRNYIGVLEDGSDILALLTTYQKQKNSAPDFVLMDHIEGIEVGIGAYFNGKQFLKPACLDWEHKRFFPGAQGELTGEMGTVVTFEGADIIFEKTLARIESKLKENGYCGYININLIANQEGLWPLEFTSRFGYPGFAICGDLQLDSWPALFQKLLNQESTVLNTRKGFATGIVLTVPPFPYSHGYELISKGLPVLFRDMTEEDINHLHLAEVAIVNQQRITSGMVGYIGVANGLGPGIASARANAYALARKVIVPNIRYRNDIGNRLLEGDYEGLKALGYIA